MSASSEPPPCRSCARFDPTGNSSPGRTRCASGCSKTTRDLPTLELAFDDKAGTLAFRWRAGERAFAMPIRVGDPKNWQVLRPTTDWQLVKAPLPKDSFEVATDLYYVNVVKQ